MRIRNQCINPLLFSPCIDLTVYINMQTSPATKGESCSSFWRSGSHPFWIRKVALPLRPYTTARNRGVSPFSVRHWQAPWEDPAAKPPDNESICPISESSWTEYNRARTWEDNLQYCSTALYCSLVQRDPTSLVHFRQSFGLYRQSAQCILIAYRETVWGWHFRRVIQ